MVIDNEKTLSEQALGSVVFDIESRVRKYPNTDLWWFGSSVDNKRGKINDLDFAIINTSVDILRSLQKELLEVYPDCHIDRARMYTKSPRREEITDVPLHFILGLPRDVSLNIRLSTGIRNGIRIR